MTKIDSGLSKEWVKKRQRTFFVYMFQYFLNGLERSANTATLWIYVTTLMKTDHEETYYGLINSGIYISPILFAVLLGRQADKSRNIKFWLLLCNFLSLAGSILYVVPFSPWYAFTGKFLNGFNLILRPLMVGEIARAYPKSETRKKIPLLATISCIGFAIGPVFTALFLEIDFYIGFIHITYGNISGLVVFLLTLLLQIAVLLFATDLSKEFDLKSEESKKPFIEEMDTELIATELTSSQILMNALSNFDYLLILAMTFYSAFLNVQLFRLLPIIIIQTLNYSYLIVNYAYFAHSVFGLLMLIILLRCKYGNRGLYISGVISIVMTVIIAVCISLFTLPYKGYKLGIPLIAILLVALNLFEIGEQLFLIVALANSTTSSNQIYLESVRFMFKQIGSLLGAFTSAYAIFDLRLYSGFVGCSGFLFTVLLIARKNTLSNPTPHL